MRCLVRLMVLLAAVSGCMTTDESTSNPKHSGGTTVGNGRLVPTGIAVRYASDGSGIDGDTKRAVDSLIEQAQGAGKVSSKVSKTLGREGETVDCIELNDASDLAPLKAKICAALKAGNDRRKAVLSSAETVFRCTADVMKAATNDGDC